MELAIKGFGKESFDESVDLITLSKKYQENFKSPIVAGIVNNNIRELTYLIEEDATVGFLDMTSHDGMKIYRRTLTFLFIKACKDVLKGCKVHIAHSLGNGLYCEVFTEGGLNADDVEKIEDRMRDLQEKDIPILLTRMPTEDAIKMFKKQGIQDKARALKYRRQKTVKIYDLDGMKDYFYGYMLPSTGYLKWFKLIYHLPGVIIQLPSRENPTKVAPYCEQAKLSRIFRESERWARILNVADVGALNDLVTHGEAGDVIRVSEALHEKKIAEIADRIYEDKDRIRLIQIAGPSSSGKTTFAQRLIVQLRVNGLRPISISVDDYFLERDKTPLGEDGKPNFEALEAVDIKLLNQHLTKLIQGKEVIMPKYNFHTGKREHYEEPISVEKDHPIIIEGLHCLNDRLTPSIPRDNKFIIYVSALTQLNIDFHNRISTTDTRLLRRIVRDSWSRSSDARKTIAMWPSVLKGAKENIFPYQEKADVMFNSALVYELSVLKKYAVPLLKEVKPEHPEYIVAKYLLKFLQYFVSIEDEKDVPSTSIIREFIGGSCFFS